MVGYVASRIGRTVGSLSIALTAALGATADEVDQHAFPEVFNTQEQGQEPPTPEEAARSFRVPEGFNVTLFAGEPDVQQPICFAFDDRGRIWVAECYSYSGHGFERKLRDRIIILADHDGDGRHDERQVFWEGGNVLTSLAWGFGGLFILEDGKLKHLPDRDRDDVPDGPPTVLLEGFDLQNAGHNVVNGLMWGPDGWLYGRHGIQGTSYVGTPGTPPDERTPLNASIWRFHPTRHEFEVLTHGTTNPWGLDYNDYGEFFFTNNVIGHLWHMVPGAHYERMYGVDFNPHVYELIDQTADHYHWDADSKSWNEARDAAGKNDEAGGGHSHCGGMIYLGDNWPEEYRGRMFMCNTHGRRINQDILVREGTGYVAGHGPDLAFAGTPWFRGVQLAYGPDGGVYVSDWSGLGECHDHDGVHRTSGRIYKITYGDPEPVDEDLDVAALSIEELVGLQLHQNDWYVRHARRVLQERAAAGDDMSTFLVALREMLAVPQEPRVLLRLLWAANVVAKDKPLLFEEIADGFEDEEDEHVQAWKLRLLADAGGADFADAIGGFAHSRSPISPLVRRHLASSMRRMPADAAFRVARNLACVEEDVDDPVQQRMIWYGIEPHVVSHWRDAVVLAEMTRFPRLRRFLARRLTSAIEDQPQAVDALLHAILQGADDGSSSRGFSPEQRPDVLQGMAEALKGRTKAPMPRVWPEVDERLGKSNDSVVQKLTRELAIVFGDGRALDDLLEVVHNENIDIAQRRDALATLAEHRTPDLEPLLFNSLGDRALAAVAARGLANYEHPETGNRLVRRWWRLKQDARQAAITTLCSRPAYARALLAAMAEDEVPREAMDVIHARQIRSLGDEQVAAMLTQVWGSIRETPAEKKQTIERFKNELTEERLANASLENGRQLFQKKCATCHTLFGEGEAIGPDLTGSDRRNLHYVLENIIDPSAVVPEAHRMSILQTDTGRTITGVVLQDDGQTVEVQTEEEKLVLAREEIETLEATGLSLMPDGLLSDLSDAEVRDLVAYMQK